MPWVVGKKNPILRRLFNKCLLKIASCRHTALSLWISEFLRENAFFSQLLEEFVDAQQVPCLRCFLVLLNVHNINFNLPDSEAATLTALETFPWKGHLLIVGFPAINIIPSNK